MSNDSQGNGPGPKPFGGTALMPSFPGGVPQPPPQQAQPPQYGQPPQQAQPAQYGQPPQGYGPPPPPQQDAYGAPQGYAPPSAYGHDPYAAPPPAGGYGYPQAPQQQAYGQPPQAPTQDQYAQAYGQQPGYPQQPAQPYGQYAQPYAPPAQHVHGDTALPCPKCNQMTTSMKSYTMVQFLLFIWFFAFWRRQTLTLCPSCMRNELLMKTLINLIPANLLWLVLVLPWHTVLFCMTFADGHSSKVRFAMQQR